LIIKFVSLTSDGEAEASYTATVRGKCKKNAQQTDTCNIDKIEIVVMR